MPAALALCREALPPTLVSAGDLEVLCRFADRLPNIWRWGVIETRLGGPGPIDLMGCIRSDERGRQSVRAVLEADALGPVLSGARRALESWARADAESSHASVIWFEWDAPLDERRSSVVLVSMDPRFWGDARATPLPLDVVLERMSRDEQLLGGEPLSAHHLAETRRCLAALDGNDRCLMAGSLRSRGRDCLRLLVRIASRELVPWLRRIEWRGDREAVGRWANRVAEPWEAIFVQIELVPELGAYLGVEMTQTGRGFPERRRAEEALSWCTDLGLATPERSLALLAWPGESRARSADDEVTLLRSFHLKLTFAEPSPPVLKGYLGFHVQDAR